MKKRKLIATGLTILLSSGIFTGCSLFRSDVTDNNKTSSTNDSGQLESGKYYIWHDEEQANIENDLGVDLSQFEDYDYDIFSPVYQEHSVLTDKDIGNPLRVSMMLSKTDYNIPTYYQGDELIYYSTSEIPKAYTLERYYDHGYSFGIYGLTEYVVGSGIYALDTKSSNMGYLPGSSVGDAISARVDEQEVVLSFPSIDEDPITSEDISTAGTIKGLLRDSEYNLNIYVGTHRNIVKAVADTRVFSSYERAIPIVDYSFVGENVVKITLPDYLKSGYYNINGAGMFRYIAEGDTYDSTTNFNEPIIEKDDNGEVVYNPIPSEDEFYKAPVDNTDYINDYNNAAVVRRTIKVKEDTESVKLTVVFNTSLIPDDPRPEISIKYYQIGSVIASEDIPTKNNPLTLSISEMELREGKIEREFTVDTLSIGSWAFEIEGLNNYENSQCSLQEPANESSID